MQVMRKDIHTYTRCRHMQTYDRTLEWRKNCQALEIARVKKKLTHQSPKLKKVMCRLLRVNSSLSLDRSPLSLLIEEDSAKVCKRIRHFLLCPLFDR